MSKMYKLLIGPVSSDKIYAALLQEGKLYDYHEMNIAGSRKALGDIVLAKVKDVKASIGGAFLDIGDKKEAFLPLDKGCDLSEYKKGTELAVEIRKEAEGNKGCAVTDKISLKSSHVVITYKNTIPGVSKKITDEEERKRLRMALKSFPEDKTVGYILRTESQGIEASTLVKEASDLLRLMKEILNKAKYTPVGGILYAPGSEIGKYIQDIPFSQTEEIIIEGKELFGRIREEMRQVSKEREEKLRLWDDPERAEVIYRIPSQVKEALDKRVDIPGGGYLFVEETEAACIIDVNTGKTLTGKDKEEAILGFNLKAVEEIIRQIRVRDLSGILLIDFVSMEKEASKEALTKAMEEAVLADLHKCAVYGLTRLQLMEMTREKKERSLRARLNSFQ